MTWATVVARGGGGPNALGANFQGGSNAAGNAADGAGESGIDGEELGAEELLDFIFSNAVGCDVRIERQKEHVAEWLSTLSTEGSAVH